MRTIYCCHGSKDAYKHYFKKQSGGEMSYFAGRSYQKGHGIGSFFSNLFQKIAPIGKQLLSTGLKIGSDVLAGQSLKDAAITRGKDLAKDVIQDVTRRINMGDNAATAQSGSGKRKRHIDHKNGKIKKAKRDIFA